MCPVWPKILLSVLCFKFIPKWAPLPPMCGSPKHLCPFEDGLLSLKRAVGQQRHVGAVRHLSLPPSVVNHYGTLQFFLKGGVGAGG